MLRNIPNKYTQELAVDYTHNRNTDNSNNDNDDYNAYTLPCLISYLI